MRQGEIMGLTWNRVDLENNRITLDKTKNGDMRVVPLDTNERTKQELEVSVKLEIFPVIYCFLELIILINQQTSELFGKML